MAQGGNWFQKLTGRMQLFDEPLPGVPIIEIAGDRRVLVERHRGIIQYTDHRIQILVSYGIISVSGQDLVLIQMSKHQLAISGEIDAVEIQREVLM